MNEYLQIELKIRARLLWKNIKLTMGWGRFGQTKNCSIYNEAIGTIIRVASVK